LSTPIVPVIVALSLATASPAAAADRFVDGHGYDASFSEPPIP